jgi:CRP-like cAMP-binding protein
MLYELIRPYLKSKHERRLKRGEIVYHLGEAPDFIYFLETGLVGLFHLTGSGKETFFRVFGPNDVMGHRSFFADEPYHASSIALSSVSLRAVPAEVFGEICERNPLFLREIASTMAVDLGSAELRMAGLLDKTAHKRITESLVYLKLKYPDQVWTRKEIAEYSGSTFETVTRVMTILEKKQFIKKKGRDFSIQDPERLLALKEDQLH